MWLLLNLYLLCLATWRKDIKPQDVEEAINSAVPGKLVVKSVSGVSSVQVFGKTKLILKIKFVNLYFDVALEIWFSIETVENFVYLYLSLSLSHYIYIYIYFEFTHIGCYLL
jgi:hypothetical protein